jgi:putative transposase
MTEKSYALIMSRVTRSKTILAPGEHYHVLNRGAEKQTIFRKPVDYKRFLFLTLAFQYQISIPNIQRLVQHPMLHKEETMNELQKLVMKQKAHRLVDLVSFCIMPNHFHFLLLEKIDGGTSRYMQRVQNGYGKYFNTRYEHSGHVFQGKFKRVHIESNEQLLHVSAYIHKNPIEIQGQKRTDFKTYAWSSCQDYILENRFGDFLQQDIILEQFKTPNDYKNFLLTSTAKENLNTLT